VGTTSLIELESFFPYRLTVLANVMASAIATAYVERYDLTIPEWRVIAVLARYPGLSAREVADKTRMDAVAVSRAVNRLIRSGRIRRKLARDDRRRSILQVSDAGAAVYREVAPLAIDFERNLLSSLTPDERKVLDRMVALLTDRAEQLLETTLPAIPAAQPASGTRRAVSRRRIARLRPRARD
jgi:DNA-binding MarR family transcriptional regulator